MYAAAKEYAEKIKEERPSLAAEKDVAVALVVTDKGENFVGVTGVRFRDGNAEDVPAELIAVLMMKNQGGFVAKNLIVLSLGDLSILKPEAECLELLFRTNAENDNCMAALSEQEETSVASLRLADIGGEDFFSGFDDDEEVQEDAEGEDEGEPEAEEDTEEAEEAAAEEEETASVSSNSISGVEIDESNPFYEAPEEVKPPEDVIATIADENASEEADTSNEDDAKDKPKETLSKEELMKQAKKRKKVAKSNFLFRRRK